MTAGEAPPEKSPAAMEAAKGAKRRTSRRPKVTPATTRIAGLSHAPHLVGPIVEKLSSLSSSSSPKPPMPSVLPFPVARHRSHGPSWSAQTESEDVREEEDEDDADYNPLSMFADPLKRKPRKGVDFSRWREFVPDSPSPAATEEEVKKRDSFDAASISGISSISVEVAEKIDSDMLMNDEHGTTCIEKRAMLDSLNQEVTGNDNQGLRESTGLSSEHFMDTEGRQREGNDIQEGFSLVDDIDIENRLRLQQMSREEISEAQVEISEKMDLRIVEMLRKRGGEKSRNKKVLDQRGRMPEGPREHEGIGDDGGDSISSSHGDQNSACIQSKGLWEAWATRVENVRSLRFSLEGDLVETPDLKKMECSQYNISYVAEHDYIRTDGDPASIGYTIKEVVELIRSLVSGQRAFAWQLLANILNKALCNLQNKDIAHNIETNIINKYVDWQAVWAYALGPEPELALSFRIALDDNHGLAVSSCVKVLRCVLACGINENLFHIAEKLPMLGKGMCTAPIFRSRPDPDEGFLHGGFWKYNTKPSNILPIIGENEVEDGETKATIQDDVVVAGQDVAAGLIRMGTLIRICYLIEMDPSPALEGSLLSVLTALARHSPTSANAIMRCPRLVETVVKLFTQRGSLEIQPGLVEAVVLLKVLSQSSRQICLDLVSNGVFQVAMWHWYKPTFSLDYWVKCGKDHCKLSSELMVEQLRFWRICIKYGFCVSYFTDFFPVLCLWLAPPTFEMLMEKDVISEFTSITIEAYLVLEALAQKLPVLHSMGQLNTQGLSKPFPHTEAWSWGHVVPIVDLAIKWLTLGDLPYISSLVGRIKEVMRCHMNSSLCCMIWVISSVLHMLGTVFGKILLDIVYENKESKCLPWLPQFVPAIGLKIVENGFLNFSVSDESEAASRLSNGGSLAESLCYLRRVSSPDAALACVSCLHGLVRLVSAINDSILRARSSSFCGSHQGYSSGMPENILAEGIVKCAKHDLRNVLGLFVSLVSFEWHLVQSAEIFGRGGPAPGIGAGWGAYGGGFWSASVFLAQLDAILFVDLLKFFPVVVEKNITLFECYKPGNTASHDKNITFPVSQRIGSVLEVCLIVGPADKMTLKKAFDILFESPVMNYFGLCIHHLRKNKGFNSYDWQYSDDEYLSFGSVLKFHFRKKWLGIKKKSSDKLKSGYNSHNSPEKANLLETIVEDEESEVNVGDLDQSSLLVEWAHQRLPLPKHWFLSAILNIDDLNSGLAPSLDALNLTKCGIFLLLGLEATSFLSSDHFVISNVPLVWKIHALSVALYGNMNILEEKGVHDLFETLQDLYGEKLDESKFGFVGTSLLSNEKSFLSFSSSEAFDNSINSLNFTTVIHESYTTFVEKFVEQFAAISYGDKIYGRQAALYLHRYVDTTVRLAAWKALFNTYVLDLLPLIDDCIGGSDGYLEPVEDDEDILEAYAKFWMCDNFKRAAAKGSISFTLVLHHLSCFIFKVSSSDKAILLQKRLAKYIVRNCSLKQHDEIMLLDLIRYRLPTSEEARRRIELAHRFAILRDACQGNSSLLTLLERNQTLLVGLEQ